MQKFIRPSSSKPEKRVLNSHGLPAPVWSDCRALVFLNSANPLISKVQQLFGRNLALENDYLPQENKILRRKFGAHVPLSESDRRILVKYGLRIKNFTPDFRLWLWFRGGAGRFSWS